MALTGIEIFKHLPKTNCGKCGVPTCLAFAMSLATGKAELSACPSVSDEAKAKLEEASAPPIRLISIATGAKPLKVGGETVLFRHEKRLENPPGIAIPVSDAMADAEISRRLNSVKFFRYERVGMDLHAELVAVKYESGDPAAYAALAGRVKKETDAGLILICEDMDALKAAVTACAERKPLLYCVTAATADLLAPFAQEQGLPVVAKGANLDDLAGLTEKLGKLGIKDIFLDSSPQSLKQAFADQISIRRAALLKKVRSLGFPTITFASALTDNPLKEGLIAATLMAKYAGIIVLSDFYGETLFPLLVARMNLFTDPQRPLATGAGIYEIGGPNENSPVLLTCNFSLTYFIVSGEIENTRIPAYLLIKDTEGLSVMTAWAAGKFSSDAIAAFIKKSGIADKVKHRKLIIPGYLASESGGLEEELSDWEILVGPREAAHLLSYLKNNWKP